MERITKSDSFIIIKEFINKIEDQQDYFAAISEMLNHKMDETVADKEFFRDLNIFGRIIEVLNYFKDDYKNIYDISKHHNEVILPEVISSIWDQIIQLNDGNLGGEEDDPEIIKQSRSSLDKYISRAFMNDDETPTSKYVINFDYFGVTVDDTNEVSIIYQSRTTGNEGYQNMNNLVKSIRNISQLRTSTVITLANTFELLISKIFMCQFTLDSFSNGNDIGKKTLTLEEIQNLGSLDAAEDFLLESSVSEVMRKSASDWINKLGKINNKIFKLNNEKDKMIEFFQRRNIIVHNNGVINSYYLNNVGEDFTRDLEKGKTIDVDKDYISDKITECRLFGLKIFWLWFEVAFKGDIKAMASLYADFSFKLLEDKKFDEARHVYNLILDYKHKLDSSLAMKVNINLIQTYKWQDKKDKVEEEVNKLDFSMANEEYLMCRCLLLDDFNGALTYMKKKLRGIESKAEQQELIDAYLRWPLFKNILTNETFIDYLDTMGYNVDVVDDLKEKED
ncbi:hypothetical protein [Leuconostoc mesenteroides]|uniref:hypothetical protein n=1 Tax=Leuconostoc mesenteroides TaxID=1245 RepID=UPI0032DE651A